MHGLDGQADQEAREISEFWEQELILFCCGGCEGTQILAATADGQEEGEGGRGEWCACAASVASAAGRMEPYVLVLKHRKRELVHCEEAVERERGSLPPRGAMFVRVCASGAE